MPALGKRPVVVVVRDGWGHNPFPKWNHANAILLADTPVADRLMAECPTTLIRTSGEDVGLPDGVMGNSEVGHQNIGAGRIVDQELMRITRRFRSNEMFENPVLKEAMSRAKQGGRLHFMGLMSYAGVHSDLSHLFGLLQMAKMEGVPGDRVFIHCFADGRDSPPTAGARYCRELEAKLKELGVGRIASVVGRFYAMDRDNRWDRVEKSYRLLTQGQGKLAPSAEAAFLDYYEHPTDANRIGDEFIEPTAVSNGQNEPLAVIDNGDAVCFFNFRGDRPRELTMAFVADTFPYMESTDSTSPPVSVGFHRNTKLDLYFATLTEYKAGLPVHVAIPKPQKMVGVLGDFISQQQLRQFRCAETEKFPHVTFFFNDYREPPFPGEDREIIPSPRDVPTYDLKPEMSAEGVTQAVLRRIESDQYDLIVVNYANGDMVGHTGSLPATIAAIECVDRCVGRLVDAVLQKGGALIVTADHGNAEQMIDPVTGGPHTSHTTYDVPLILVDADSRGRRLREGGRLADIAPTALELMGLEAPPEMTGRSLLIEV